VRNSTRCATISASAGFLTNSITCRLNSACTAARSCAAPAPFEGRLVVVHLHAVELHGAHQRGVRQRHAALLPGVAQHQRVGVDAVAQQLHGHLLGVEVPTSSAPTAAAGALAVAAWELPVGVGDERGRGRAMVFSATKVRPGCITASVALFAATMGSQPITRSALAVSTLVV
jgi:hypothetical protein